MPILTKLKDFLDANQVGYEVRSHPRAVTAQEVAAARPCGGGRSRRWSCCALARSP